MLLVSEPSPLRTTIQEREKYQTSLEPHIGEAPPPSTSKLRCMHALSIAAAAVHLSQGVVREDAANLIEMSVD